MKFDRNIINESLTTFIDYITDPNKYKAYSFELPEGFNDVPVMDQVRCHSELLTEKDKMTVGEKLTRTMISGKPIEVFLDNKPLGKIIMNGDASWDTIKIFRDHPFSLNTLIEICLGDLMGKYLPPLKNIEIPQAEAKT
jgi:hypothetical protein